MCDDFKERRRELFNIAKEAIGKPKSKWKLLSSWNEFALAVHKADGAHIEARLKRPLDVLALTVPRTCAALGRRNVFTKATFLEFISRGLSCTRTGMCGG